MKTFKKEHIEELIEKFGEDNFKLSESLLKEYLKEDGSINSWLNTIPLELLNKYKDECFISEVLEYKDKLTKDSVDIIRSSDLDLMQVIMCIINFNNRIASWEKMFNLAINLGKIINAISILKSKNPSYEFFIPNSTSNWDLPEFDIKLAVKK